MSSQEQEPAPASPPTRQQQQRETRTLWQSVENFSGRHPILYEVLCIVREKLSNGMAEIYSDCDVNSKHYEDMMKLGGTFGLMGRVNDVEAELRKPTDQQHNDMAYAITDANGIRFNFDLVTASTTCAQRLIRENKWDRRENDQYYWAYRVCLEVLCEHELAHSKNHRYKHGNKFTEADITPGGAPLHGESGFTIERRLLQAHRKKMKPKPRSLGNIKVIIVHDYFRKNRYQDLELHYGLISAGELMLDDSTKDRNLPSEQEIKHRSLTISQMIKHVEYFEEEETLSWKKRKGGKRGKRGGGGRHGGAGGSSADKGHDGGGDGRDRDGDGADDGENESGPEKKPRRSSTRGVSADGTAAVAGLTVENSPGGGRGVAASLTRGDTLGEESASSSDESSSSSDEDDDYDQAEKKKQEEDKKQEAQYNLQEETVAVGLEKFTKYTVDCSGLKFVSEDGKALNDEELSAESKGITDRKALFVGQGDLSDKILDGIEASIEKCLATVSFCDENWNDREPATFNKNEAVCIKLKLTNPDPEESGTVAAALVSLHILGRGSLNVEIKDSQGKKYQHGPGRHFGLGTWVPIAPGKSYTFHRGLTQKTFEQCEKSMTKFVTPAPGVYSVAVIHTSKLTGRKFTFPGEFKLEIVGGDVEA